MSDVDKSLLKEKAPESTLINPGASSKVDTETHNKINLADIKKFFNYLCESPNEVFCCAFFNRDGSIHKGIDYNTLGQILAIAPDYAARGCNLHVTLNEVNYRGRSAEHVQGCRVLCVDVDRHITPDEYTQISSSMAASLAVESSPGKYHFYIKVAPGFTLDQWRCAQLGLAYGYEADLELSQITHLIRVPGFPRETKSGESFVPRITYLHTGEFEPTHMYTWQELLRTFPKLLEWKTQGERARKERQRKAKEAVTALIKEGDTLEAVVREIKESRNVNLFNLVFQYGINTKEPLTLEQALEFGIGLNRGLFNPLGEKEARECSKSAWKNAERVRIDRQVERDHARNVLIANNPEFEVPEIVTNGKHENIPHGTGAAFQYNFNVPALILSRYSESAFIERVLQRFKNQLLRVGKTVYAYDSTRNIWIAQHKDRANLIEDMYERVVQSAITEDMFKLTRCYDDKGNYSSKLETRERDKLTTYRKIRDIGLGVKANTRMITHENSSIFDATDEMILCANGVVNLVTGEIRDAKADDYLLANTGIDYDPGAKCLEWERFLRQIFARNEDTADTIRFVQEMFGYSLGVGIDEQRVFCHTGSGANGKSVLFHALSTMLGGYCASIEADTLAKRKLSNGPTFERIGAKIEDKRAAIIDDVESQTVWNEAFLKGITADTIRARGEYEQSREKPNRCKVHIGFNLEPEVEQENDGLYRRLCFIKYNCKFPVDSRKYTELKAMIQAEVAGIFNWSRAGYVRVREQGGIKYTAESIAALDDYKTQNQSLEQVLGQMYRKSTEAEDSWITNEEIESDLADYKQTTGSSGLKIEKRLIGKYFSSFAPGVRVWTEGRFSARTRKFPLVRLFEQRDSKKDL